ncbi:MAG: hypothetical protein NVS1B2_11450 [Vulcanimicrobiaceae bacterium]
MKAFRMRPSVTLRLTVLWTALFVAALVLFATLAVWLDARSAQGALDERLAIETAAAVSSFDPASGRIDPDSVAPTLDGSRLILFNDATPVQTFGDRLAAATTVAASKAPVGASMLALARGRYRIVVRGVPKRASLRVAAIASEEPVREEIERTQRTFVAIGLPITALAIGAGFLLARRALSPVDHLTRTAADVARTKRFSTRFAVVTHDELGRLGETFNTMLAGLEEIYDREHTFVGDISHELRQPLTTIAGEAELALIESDDPQRYRQALVTIDGKARSMRALIDDLLLLARADAGAIAAGASEVGESVAEAASAIRAEFATTAVTVDLQAEPMSIALAGTLAVQLFVNLIRNAAQVARGRVVVRVSRVDTDAVVTVDDDGPGFPVDLRARAFRRFARGDELGTGTGLGLAIAAALAAVASGTIAIDDSPLGGARFTVRLRSSA